MQAELRECPNPWGNYHCGPGSFYVSEWNGEQMFSWRCACGMTGPMAETKAAAIAAWNARPQAAGEVVWNALVMANNYICGGLSNERGAAKVLEAIEHALTEIKQATPAKPAGEVCAVCGCTESESMWHAPASFQDKRLHPFQPAPAEPKGEVGRLTREEIQHIRKYEVAWSGVNGEAELQALCDMALSSLQQPESARVREAAEELLNACREFFLEMVMCSRCEGSGRLWEDGKTHGLVDVGHIKTTNCPDCGGKGEVPADDTDCQKAMHKLAAALAPSSSGGKP